ncbi:MAG: hypothetical protein C5B47_07895 [Verrucomicrobia bacterium]|nr:MAG: hypothetical protein C5B47_07895 [Verrucomicrobiota bacterium]
MRYLTSVCNTSIYIGRINQRARFGIALRLEVLLRRAYDPRGEGHAQYYPTKSRIDFARKKLCGEGKANKQAALSEKDMLGKPTRADPCSF